MVTDKLVAGVWKQVEVVTAGDGKELKVFEQEFSLLGKQLDHFLLAFTQAQFLHEAALLHLQHTISFTEASSSLSASLSLQLRLRRSEEAGVRSRI